MFRWKSRTKPRLAVRRTDAMYLAGLIADDLKLTKQDLRHWVETANCAVFSEYTVPWVATECRHGHELALEWIESKKESVAASGWATLSGLVAIKDDTELDLAELKKLLQSVQKTIHQQPNTVRAVMNSFVIAVGSYVKQLTDVAIQTAKKIGPVTVDMGDTAYKVPFAPESIQKVQTRGAIGKNARRSNAEPRVRWWRRGMSNSRGR